MKKVKKYMGLSLFIFFISLAVFINGCFVQPDDIIVKETSTSEIIEIAENTETEIASEFSVNTEFGVMEIFVFAIGKADTILITTENHTVMIDTGENKHGPAILDYLLRCGITEIDYLVITHFHKDHVGGAHVIINNLDVKEAVVPNYGKESKHYDRFIAAVNDAKIEQTILKEIIKFTLDGVEFTIYPSHSEYHYYGNSDIDDEQDDDEYEDENEKDDDDDIGENITNENNFSLAVSINHGENNFLFTGDAKSKRLKELMSAEDIANTRYDYLKVPHHGRYNKRSEEFIYTVRPKYAVITCYPENPSDERVVAALENIGAEIYFTTNGGIYCESDGQSLIIEYR